MLKSLIRKDYRLGKLIFWIPFFMLTVFTVSLTGLWSYVEYNDLKERKIMEAERAINYKKSSIKHEVIRAVGWIDMLDRNGMVPDDSLMQELLLGYLNTLSIGKSGYFFVNTIGGRALVYDKRRVRNIDATRLKDYKSGELLFPKELSLYHTEGGGFMEYYFKKPDDSAAYKKVSYIMAYKPRKWIVGGGDYVIDFQKDINAYLRQLNQRLIQRFEKIGLLFILMLALAFYFSKRVSVFFETRLQMIYENFKALDEGRDEKPVKVHLVEVDAFVEHLREVIRQKNELEAELKQLNESLHDEVQAKTEDLEAKNAEQQRLLNLFEDREFRIHDLKQALREKEEELARLQKNCHE